jgi:hypothetical protein
VNLFINKWAALFLVLSTCLLGAQEKIHLVYLGFTPGEGFWERDWMGEILSGIDAPICDVPNPHYDIFLNRSLLVTSSATPWDKLYSYIQKCNAKRLKYGLILLNDETYACSNRLYSAVPFVVRNYWHKNFQKFPNLLCIPLGYKTGFSKNFSEPLKTSAYRSYTWSFAGQFTKSNRRLMIHAMQQIPNHYVHGIQSFGAHDSLLTQDCRNLLLDSVFVPCPRGGWNLDSFRVSEALEAGCIPIVEKTPFDYFGKFYGNYPCLAVSSWYEAPPLIQALLADPEQLENLRQTCHT